MQAANFLTAAHTKYPKHTIPNQVSKTHTIPYQTKYPKQPATVTAAPFFLKEIKLFLTPKYLKEWCCTFNNTKHKSQIELKEMENRNMAETDISNYIQENRWGKDILKHDFLPRNTQCRDLIFDGLYSKMILNIFTFNH